MTSEKNNGHNTDGEAPPASGAPKGPITDTMAKPRIKRFYKTASVGDTAPFQILLDGRAVKTPAKRALLLPTRAGAEAVAAEWAAQSALIHPASMPLTRFANTAIDAVADSLDEVAADIVAYAGRDLLCYRAASPPDLTQRQAAKWDPVLDWVQKTLDTRFIVVTGVMPVDQPRSALQAIAAALELHDAFRLTALHVMTTLTGSALLALARSRGFLSCDHAWAAAHVDEDYQIALWGQDEEASHRRALRTSEFQAASRLLDLVRK
jgi:chaperone required for assembly of F1-ATPase